MLVKPDAAPCHWRLSLTKTSAVCFSYSGVGEGGSCRPANGGETLRTGGRTGPSRASDPRLAHRLCHVSQRGAEGTCRAVSRHTRLRYRTAHMTLAWSHRLRARRRNAKGDEMKWDQGQRCSRHVPQEQDAVCGTQAIRPYTANHPLLQ
eukprot:scaffold114433_cov24-Tisochrysis_lutea.AAC.5